MMNKFLDNEANSVAAKSVMSAAIRSAATSADQLNYGGMPVFVTLWGLVEGLLGNAIAVREKRALEWVDFVKNNPRTFVREVMDDEAFQDGFVITLEVYLKERRLEKRKLLQDVFLGFAESRDYEKFELERLNGTIGLISVEGIKFLSFIDHGLAELGYKCDQFEKLSNIVGKYIHNEFDPNSDKVKDRAAQEFPSLEGTELLEQQYAVKKEKQQEIDDAIAELVGLGLLRLKVEGGGSIGGGGGHLTYELSGYGNRFIEFVRFH